MILDITPMATPRPRVFKGKDGKNKVLYPEKYYQYKKTLEAMVYGKFKPVEDKPLRMEVTFYMPIPSSWSKKKKELHDGEWHTSKPDADNLLKGLKDALEGVAYKNDSQICNPEIKKIYSNKPRIEFKLFILPPLLERNEHENQGSLL